MGRRTIVSNEHRLIMKQDYLNGDPARIIGEKLNYPYWTVLKHLKSMNVNIRSDHAKWIDFSKKETLAYIYGVIRGDGWASYCDSTKRYEIGLSSIDIEFVEKFRDKLVSIGLRANIYDKVNAYKNMVDTRSNSKRLKKWVDKTSPLDFETIEEKIAFLEGFYESDGTSGINIQYCNTDLDLLTATQKLLSGFGIKTTIQGPYINNYKSKYYFLYVRKRSIALFKELIKPINKFNKKRRGCMKDDKDKE